MLTGKSGAPQATGRSAKHLFCIRILDKNVLWHNSCLCCLTVAIGCVYVKSSINRSLSLKVKNSLEKADQCNRYLMLYYCAVCIIISNIYYSVHHVYYCIMFISYFSIIAIYAIQLHICLCYYTCSLTLPFPLILHGCFFCSSYTTCFTGIVFNFPIRKQFIKPLRHKWVRLKWYKINLA